MRRTGSAPAPGGNHERVLSLRARASRVRGARAIRWHVMAIHSEPAKRSSIVDRNSWLSTLQRWHPRKPRKVLIEFIDDLIEAAGPQRVERLNTLLVHTDKTTRSALEKLDKLARWRDAMRSDPWFWPQLVERDRPVSVLVKKIVDESPRPLDRFDVERKFRKYRKVPSTGLAQELKELANHGEVDRYKHGLYWRRGTAAAALRVVCTACVQAGL